MRTPRWRRQHTQSWPFFLAVRHGMLWTREDAVAQPVANNLAFFLILSAGIVVAAAACSR
jgi:hypothetical protein